MLVESFFHLDCRPVIPECGFSCDRCVDEMQSVLTGMGGVSSVSREKRRDIDGILVQHEPDAVGVEELMNVLRELPSFYQGKFEPSLQNG